jgi:hypothetical protein
MSPATDFVSCVSFATMEGLYRIRLMSRSIAAAQPAHGSVPKDRLIHHLLTGFGFGHDLQQRTRADRDVSGKGPIVSGDHAEWIARQLVEACGWDKAPRFLSMTAIDPVARCSFGVFEPLIGSIPTGVRRSCRGA